MTDMRRLDDKGSLPTAAPKDVAGINHEMSKKAVHWELAVIALILVVVWANAGQILIGN